MPLLDVNELSRELRVSAVTVRAWRRKGLIDAYQGDRKLLFDLDEVRRQMRRLWLLSSNGQGIRNDRHV